MLTLLAVSCAIVGLLLGGVLARLVEVLPDRRATLGDLRGAEVPVARGDSGSTSIQWDGFAATTVLGVATSTLFALAALRWGTSGELPIHLVLFVALVLIAAIDVDVSRIPDRIVFPLLAVSVASLLALSVVRGEFDPLLGAVIGSVFFSVALLVPHVINPLAMGFGDVKLALVLGLFLGWSGGSPADGFLRSTTGLLVGCLLGALFGVGLWVIRRANRPFPFGPALAAGTALTLLAAPTPLLP